MLDAEPRDAVDIVFTALGTTNATATVLDDVIVAALGAEPRADLAVLLPDVRDVDAAGTHRRRRRARATGSRARASRPRRNCSSWRTGAEQLHTITVPVDAVTVTPVRGIDPDAGLHVVTRRALRRARAPTWTRARGRRPSRPAGARSAHQIAGASRTMLALACAHAVERVQFGRPIARFQAVRHRLADALVAVEALDAALGAAWDEPNPLTAALAKAIAGRTARTVATHCQQVLAGIGFTTDHPFHRYFKRTLGARGLVRARRRHRHRHRTRAARDPLRSHADRALTHRKAHAVSDFDEPNFDEIDFFRDQTLVADPYPYFEFMREQCPVRREPQPRRRDGDGLRRGDRGVPRHRDVLVVQLGHRTVPGFPGAARRRRRQRAHRAAPRRAPDERPAPDARPARCTPRTAGC